jgi:hypothetical protein
VPRPRWRKGQTALLELQVGTSSSFC